MDCKRGRPAKWTLNSSFVYPWQLVHLGWRSKKKKYGIENRVAVNSVYSVNRGINKEIEFRGIKAQYLGYMAAGLLILLILFAVMYLVGVPILLCLPLILVAGFVLMAQVLRFSQKYGRYGLMKGAAYRGLPPAITCRSRKMFFDMAVGTK